MRRRRLALLVSVTLAVVAGLVWYVWVAGRCASSHGDGASWFVGAMLVVVTVLAADRFTAWQTRSPAGSIGIDIVTMWLVLVSLVAASLIAGGVNGCLS